MSTAWSWDHPRVCGKNFVSSLAVVFIGGSPPRVREKPWLKLTIFPPFGITPACAGKTENAFHATNARRDHPRVCGKNFKSIVTGIAGAGSPPRVREKPVTCPLNARIFRITPACAGKTICRFQRWRTAWDHPRVCGKNNS